MNPPFFTNNRLPLIIAHRGASKIRYENTLEAFSEAIRMGAHGIEMDIRATADGILVVHHNQYLRGIRRKISRLSLEELKHLSNNLTYRIPTLEETLRFCAKKTLLDIELKEVGYEEEVLNLVSRYFPPGKVVFTSFNESSVKRLKERHSDYAVGLLIGWRGAASIMRNRHSSPWVHLKHCQADFIAPHWRLVNKRFIRNALEHDYPVVVWTVDRLSVARKLLELDVAGIIINRPDRLLPLVKTNN